MTEIVSPRDTELLLRQFSELRLPPKPSYVPIHNNVDHFDYVRFIPRGAKAWIWFRWFFDRPHLFLIELFPDGKPRRIQGLQSPEFAPDLFSHVGTVMFGTLFFHRGRQFCSVEELFLYMGRPIHDEIRFDQKLACVCDVLHHDIQMTSSSTIVFGVPVTVPRCALDDAVLESIRYPLYHVEYVRASHPNRYFCLLIRLYHMPREEEGRRLIAAVNRPRPGLRRVLYVKADLRPDIYHLYAAPCATEEVYEGFACVPTYALSVKLNTLFRRVKGNASSDAIEESDAEEDFENDQPDKFVFLDKVVAMVCVMHPHFQRWMPEEEVSPNKASSVLPKAASVLPQATPKVIHLPKVATVLPQAASRKRKFCSGGGGGDRVRPGSSLAHELA